MEDLDIAPRGGRVRRRNRARLQSVASTVGPTSRAKTGSGDESLDADPSAERVPGDERPACGEYALERKMAGHRNQRSRRCARCTSGAGIQRESDDVSDEEETDEYRPERTEEMTSEAIIAAALAAAPRSICLRHPHLRRIYLTVFILISLLLLIPSWIVWYTYRPNRPRQSWSIQRCVRVRWSRLLCGLVARCEMDYLGRNLAVEMLPADLKHSHPITIPPAPARYLRGHAKEMLDKLHDSRGAWVPRMIYRPDTSKEDTWGRWDVREDRKKEYGFEEVVGFWFTGEKASPDEGPKPVHPGDPVGLHFHGGGYLCGTAAETDLTSSIPKTLVVHSPIHHILSVDYRLAPTAPWPLPLLDAISAYVHLVTPLALGGLGVAARDIVLFGDSAGGHLALALVRWLRDEGPNLELDMPRGVVLMSPWVDVGFTTAWGNGKEYNRGSDVIDDTFGPFASSLLFRAIPGEVMHESAYLSPGGLLVEGDSNGYSLVNKGGNGGLEAGETCCGPSGTGKTEGMFAGHPPTFVVYGGAERLGPSIRLFYERLCRDSLERYGSEMPDSCDICDRCDCQSRDGLTTPSDISEVLAPTPRSLASRSLPWSDRPAGNVSPTSTSRKHPHKILVGPDAVHDFLIFPWMQEEAAVVYRELDVWLRQLLASGDPASDSETEETLDTVSLDPPYEAIHSPSHSKIQLAPSPLGDLPTPTAFILDESTSPQTPFFSPRHPGMGRRMSSILMPLSAMGASQGPDAAAQSAEDRAKARQRRRNSRRSILVDRSPVLEPQKVGVRGMVHDMRTEAMTYLNLDEDSSYHGSSSKVRGGDSDSAVERTKERWVGERTGWLANQVDRLTPFTAQLEKGEWDWELDDQEDDGDRTDQMGESGGRGWYELEVG